MTLFTGSPTFLAISSGVASLPLLLDDALGDLVELVHGLGQMDRDANGPALVGDGPGDGLADPPGGVGRELVAATVVELVGGPHQADIALLNEVQKLKAPVLIFFGDGNDEPQVGGDRVLFLALSLVSKPRLTASRIFPDSVRRRAEPLSTMASSRSRSFSMTFSR